MRTDKELAKLANDHFNGFVIGSWDLGYAAHEQTPFIDISTCFVSLKHPTFFPTRTPGGPFVFGYKDTIESTDDGPVFPTHETLTQKEFDRLTYYLVNFHQARIDQSRHSGGN